MMRTTQGLEQVHVIYRRVDDEFLDPVHFRADSMLGCPGLMNAARAGNVTIANAVGNGVADDKLVYTYLPDLIRYYLDEEPVLANVDTWRCGDDPAREEVLDRLDELVLKPVDGSGGKGIVIGPNASAKELDVLRAKILRDPRAWIAQPVVQLSTVPTLVDDGMRPRHVDLRPFAVNDGHKVWVLPGGLTRVALPEGELIVNSSRGGGSKDTWVLAGGRLAGAQEPCPVPPDADSARSSARRRPGGRHQPTTHEQQQQQQQGQTDAEPHRGVDVLDRPLRRAGRGHRTHPRGPDPDDGRGPDGRHRLGLPDAALGHGHRDHPTAGMDAGVRAATGSRSTPTRARRSRRRSEGARESARRARETLSTDMWEVINSTYRNLVVRPVPGDAHARTRSAGSANAPRSSTAPRTQR